MINLIVQPMLEMSCPECDRRLVLKGGEPVTCCTGLYILSLSVHRRDAAEESAYRAEIQRQLHKPHGETITVPEPPSDTLLADLWVPRQEVTT